jgi:hypothetical protein
MPAAFTSDGQLFGMHSIEGNRVGISVFDESTSSWSPMPWLPNGWPLGADGMRLVYQRRSTSVDKQIRYQTRERIPQADPNGLSL